MSNLLTKAWSHASRHQVWSAVIAGVVMLAVTGIVTNVPKMVISHFKGDQLPEIPWGPPRTAYHCYNKGQECYGADHIVFNSTVDNPVVGDERGFLSAYAVGSSDPVTDSLKVHPGEVVGVRAYYANSADATQMGPGKDIAKDVRFWLSVPTFPSSAQIVTGFISSANADPKTVYDGTRFVSSTKFRLQYQLDSAELSNREHPSLHLSPNIIGDGVQLGYGEMNGEISGCYCQAGYIHVQFKVVAAN